MSTNDIILTVDDEPNNLRALKIDLENENKEIMTAKDGVEAWEIVQKYHDRIAVILLDRMMPRMDGMEFLKLLKSSEYNRIPVIMQTAAAEKEQVVQGIEAGVYYYLTKPYDKNVMLSIVRSAIKDYDQYRKLLGNLDRFRSKIYLIRDSHFEIHTLDDAEYLSTFVSQFFPDPARVVLGVSELLTNAIEHGNLGITYDEKSILNREGKWLSEIERRLAMPENQEKKALVSYVRSKDNIVLTIKDEGNGFDWEKYLYITPDRATDSHGRGIAISRMLSFDSMEYTGNGSEVVCTILLH